MNHEGVTTHINQASQQAIVDYTRFDVATGGVVKFNQPNSQAAILNRVNSLDASVINGDIHANGRVFFFNRSGVVIGEGATIRAQAFIAGAGNINNEQFLSGDWQVATSGAVENRGTIEAIEDVLLIGDKVINTGDIRAGNWLGIATGREVLIQEQGSAFQLQVDVLKQDSDAQSGIAIVNTGNVEAEDIAFKASDVYALGIQAQGKIKAKKQLVLESEAALELSGELEGGERVSAQAKKAVFHYGSLRSAGGEVEVLANGNYNASGSASIDVSAKQAGSIHIDSDGLFISSGNYSANSADGKGGNIDLTSSLRVSLLGSQVLANGTTEGGSIRVGGEFRGGSALVIDEITNAQEAIIAPGTLLQAVGNQSGSTGGDIVVWAEQVTEFYGRAEATGDMTGGDIEVSGKSLLRLTDAGLQAELVAGEGGTVLLDPKNIVISNTAPTAVELASLVVRDPGANNALLEHTRYSEVALNGAGDRIAIGARSDTGADGAVYLFTLDPNDLTQPAALQQVIEEGTDGVVTGGGFGDGVSFNTVGDVLAIGQPDHNFGRGGVSLFRLDPTDLSQTADFVRRITDGSATSLGADVALNGAGDLLVASVWRVGGGFGAVRVYGLDLTNDLTPTLHAAFVDPSGTGQFGNKVDVNNVGDFIAVSGAGTSNPVVYLLSYDPTNPATNPVLEQTITSLDAGFSSINLPQFGTALALNGAGNILAISGVFSSGGTPVFLFDVDPDALSTAVVRRGRFDRGEGISDQVIRHVGSTGEDIRLGLDGIALNDTGNLLLQTVRDYTLDGDATNRAGGAYLWELNPNDLTQIPVLRQEIASRYLQRLQDSSEFNASVALNRAGNILAVGAPESDIRDTNEGAAYIFELDPSDLTQSPILRTTLLNGSGGLAERFVGFGQAISLNAVGDLLAVAADSATYLFDVTVSDLNQIPRLQYQLDPGASVSSLSLNGTGDRLAVGVESQREVYLYEFLSEEQGYVDNHVLTPESSFASTDRFGFSVAFNEAADILIVGAPDSTGIGRVDVYSNSGFTPSFVTSLYGPNVSGAQFGASVALNSPGDILAVGAIGSGHEQVYIHEIDTSDLTQILVREGIADGTDGFSVASSERFGAGVALNGPGNLLAVSSHFVDASLRLSLFSLNPSNLSLEPDFMQEVTHTTALPEEDQGFIVATSYVPTPINPPVGNAYAFADDSGATTYFTPAFINTLLQAGTDVVLQANNDISVFGNIVGGGGDLTLQAGRSITVTRSDIDLGNHDLTLIANARAVDGVVDAERDAGLARMDIFNSNWIGIDELSLVLSDGAGNTHHDAGGVYPFLYDHAAKHVGGTVNERV